MMTRTGIVKHPIYLEHKTEIFHPENPARLQSIYSMLEHHELGGGWIEVEPRYARMEELLLVHDAQYLDRVLDSAEKTRIRFDPDTVTSPKTYKAAWMAAGGVMEAIRSVLKGEISNAFALIRPPGHHALRDRAMGFCIFNNVAVAAQHALLRLGMERVFIFDWDVHHGNGTMHSFYKSERVLYLSIHQYPHYPGTGRVEEIGSGPGAGYTVNVPLPAGQGDDDYAAVVERVLRPVVLGYRPQLLLVSAGFDIARDDPLVGMDVTPAGFARMTEALLALSADCCPGRLVFVLEGGYDLHALSGGVSAVLSTLAQGSAAGPARAPGQGPSAETRAVIDAVARALRPYWAIE